MRRWPRGSESTISMMKLGEVEMVDAGFQDAEKETSLKCLQMKPSRTYQENIESFEYLTRLLFLFIHLLHHIYVWWLINSWPLPLLSGLFLCQPGLLTLRVLRWRSNKDCLACLQSECLALGKRRIKQFLTSCVILKSVSGLHIFSFGISTVHNR